MYAALKCRGSFCEKKEEEMKIEILKKAVAMLLLLLLVLGLCACKEEKVGEPSSEAEASEESDQAFDGEGNWVGWEEHHTFSKIPKPQGVIEDKPINFGGYYCRVSEFDFDAYENYVELLEGAGFVCTEKKRANQGNGSFANTELGLLVSLTHAEYYRVVYEDETYENLPENTMDFGVEFISAANELEWESYPYLQGLPKYEGGGYFNPNTSILENAETFQLIIRGASSSEAQAYLKSVDGELKFSGGEANTQINGKNVRFRYNGNFDITVTK